jgi:hypothetical protein
MWLGCVTEKAFTAYSLPFSNLEKTEENLETSDRIVELVSGISLCLV